MKKYHVMTNDDGETFDQVPLNRWSGYCQAGGRFATAEEIEELEAAKTVVDEPEDSSGGDTITAEQIYDVLIGMDPDDDEIWTKSGQPRMEYIEAELGDDSITREDVENAAPEFDRAAAAQLRDDAGE